MNTNNPQPGDIGPSNPARKPLSAGQTDTLYKASKSMETIRHELTGRILLDYGLRAGELAHSFPTWIVEKRHPKTGKSGWAVEIPDGAKCYGGNKSAQQGNKTGADLHNTSDPCSGCVNRSYDDKDWVDDEFHKETPWHPKTSRSYQMRVWCIPKKSAEETARLWKNFLKPDRQWPVTANTVNDDVTRIVDRANELAEENDDVEEIDRKVHAHALRHTFGCRLAAAGYEPTARMNQLRHSSYEMALYYSQAWGLRHRDQIQDSDWDANEDF